MNEPDTFVQVLVREHRRQSREFVIALCPIISRCLRNIHKPLEASKIDDILEAIINDNTAS